MTQDLSKKFVCVNMIHEATGLHHETIKGILRGNTKMRPQTRKRWQEGIKQLREEMEIALEDLKYYEKI